MCYAAVLNNLYEVLYNGAYSTHLSEGLPKDKGPRVV